MKKSGFTLIELILVVSLVLIIATMTTPFAGSFLLRTYHDTATSHVISAIHRAQSLAMDGKGGTGWGICLNGQTLRVYQGTCNAPTLKEDSTIPATISVTGLSDTTFTRTTGTSSNTLNITISSSIKTTSITTNEMGVLSVN